MKLFIDNFSKQAESYLKFRPSYPLELFEFLNSQTCKHQLAWDCGTGNGQSAISLTDYYNTVYATDPSKQQIENAIIHKKIIYKVETAEKTNLEDRSVDLITVAQAVHWFDFDKFYAEVKRVLKENGVIAVWTYGLPIIDNQIDKIIRDFHDNIVGEFWQAENKLIDNEYSTIPFPFEAIVAPKFSIQKELSFNEIIGLLKTWSATQKYIDKYQKDPIKLIENELRQLWTESDNKKSATWELILKVGRNVIC
jgi:ubiquinone/menaquinone biosynthesis C-methylase UbiE